MIVLTETALEYGREVILLIPKKGGLCGANFDVFNYFSEYKS